MKTYPKGVLALALTSLLAGSVALASQASGTVDPAGAPTPAQHLPTEARNGSIQVKGENEAALAAQSRITAVEAAQIATAARAGRIVETQLGNENGSLIWEVTQLDDQGREIQLKLDAGNGKLLAAEQGDHQDGNSEDREDSDADEGRHGAHEDEGQGRDG